MTGRKLMAYWAKLLIGAIFTGAVFFAINLGARDIAEKIAPAFEMPSDAYVREAVIKDCDKSYRRFDENCSEPKNSEIQWERTRIRQGFDQTEVDPIRERIIYVSQIIFSLILMALAVAALYAFGKWLLPNVLQPLKNYAKTATGDLLEKSDVSSLAGSYKMRRAESDFRTLKNLHDNGLISEKDFLLRKKELAEKLKSEHFE